MAARAPLPPFPRWTGAHITLTGPTHGDGTSLHIAVSAHVTRRARLWALWRAITRREVTTR